AQQEADAQAAELLDALARWAGAANAPAVDMPSELGPAELDALPGRAADSARGPLEALRTDQQGAATRRDNAGAQVADLRAERSDVEAQRDPAPPLPTLRRTERADGHALWQLVDFAPELGASDRAGLEAALQSAGLLDAWVRPGGRLLSADDLDVVLAASATDGHAGSRARSAADVLRADLPAGSDVTLGDVARILSAIGIDAGADDGAWVSVDGGWRLGPARGRATKPQAQFIGATARAQERERRLATLDAAIEIALADAEQARAEFARLGQALAALEAWVRAVPTGARLRQAWAEARLLGDSEEREEIANREAQHEAHESRAAAARAIAELDRLAATHGLPTDQGSLAAAEERLRQLVGDLGNAAGRVPGLERELSRWADDLHELRRQAAALAVEQRESDAAARRAQEVGAELAALRETADASVRELEQRVAVVRQSRAAHRKAADDADTQLGEARQQLGAVQEAVRTARERVADGAGRRSSVLAAYCALATPPGLLQAAGVEAQDLGTVASAATVSVDEPVPTSLAKSAERLAGLTAQEVIPVRNKVYAAHREASTGPAADHQPAVAPYEQWDLLAVIARDDGGEAAIAELAQRVAAAVERDRGLLTQREKQQFEQHILGELGDAIRRCRRDADELVTAMNSLLAGVTTSQGIRVRLDWKLRDDVPPEARAAVTLLAQPVGALLPEERATLRDVLHSLIEASRAQRPDLSYSEHLGAALDYRTWSEFTIRYTRPEKAGAWEKLHRRSPLSQGEQKVLCYLPLFAAAAAHFTSLAGAAPHAPRLVLLDDAFPKIDVRTHPLLFGLLVQLDLDFVITSERLWGDHETVPSLAIYEALRDPAARGVAQYEYRWDGRTLHSLG
ncbi:MAG: TIGR02680 family protein, partial [Candidatus Nanopelagicales bacterium]